MNTLKPHTRKFLGLGLYDPTDDHPVVWFWVRVVTLSTALTLAIVLYTI